MKLENLICKYFYLGFCNLIGNFYLSEYPAKEKYLTVEKLFKNPAYFEDAKKEFENRGLTKTIQLEYLTELLGRAPVESDFNFGILMKDENISKCMEIVHEFFKEND